MRLELRTQTAAFTMELPDERYELLVNAFQAHMERDDDSDALEYGIHAMMADHYEREVAMNCPASVISEDLPF